MITQKLIPLASLIFLTACGGGGSPTDSQDSQVSSAACIINGIQYQDALCLHMEKVITYQAPPEIPAQECETDSECETGQPWNTKKESEPIMPIPSTDLYVRTCQECGHKQESKPVCDYKGDSWKSTPCKKCGSEALDYGSFGYQRVEGKLERMAEDQE